MTIPTPPAQLSQKCIRYWGLSTSLARRGIETWPRSLGRVEITMHQVVECPSCGHEIHLPKVATPGDILKCYQCRTRFRLVPYDDAPANRRAEWTSSLPTATENNTGLERVNVRGPDRYCAAGDSCSCGLPKICVKDKCNCNRQKACNGSDSCKCGRALKVCTKSGCRCGRPAAHM